MNRFYRKPKPETMQKNRDFYRKNFEREIEWLKENFIQILEKNIYSELDLIN